MKSIPSIALLALTVCSSFTAIMSDTPLVYAGLSVIFSLLALWWEIAPREQVSVKYYYRRRSRLSLFIYNLLVSSSATAVSIFVLLLTQTPGPSCPFIWFLSLLIATPFLIYAVLSNLIMMLQRIHDMDRGVGTLALGLIACFAFSLISQTTGIIAEVIFWGALLFIPGTLGANKYGMQLTLFGE